MTMRDERDDYERRCCKMTIGPVASVSDDRVLCKMWMFCVAPVLVGWPVVTAVSTSCTVGPLGPPGTAAEDVLMTDFVNLLLEMMRGRDRTNFLSILWWWGSLTAWILDEEHPGGRKCAKPRANILVDYFFSQVVTGPVVTCCV